MYSLVLMSAMTTAPTTAEFNGYFRDLFNRGSCSGCTGCSGCNGCMGSSSASPNCSGCCGGSGLFSGDRIRSLFQSNNNCCGGCCGGISYSCSGCCGGSMAFASGCCGGSIVSYGQPVIIPMAGAPTPYPTYPTLPNIGIQPPATGFPPSVIPYAPPEAAPSIERQTAAPRPVATVTGSNAGGGRATVLVRLPVDAQLFADGTALKMTGAERRFITPELPGGMEFTYTFAAQYERNGEVLNVSKKVTLRPGATATVEFADLAVSTSAPKPAPTGSDAPAIKGDSVAAAAVSLPKFAPVAPVIPTKPVAEVAPAPADAKPQSATITVKVPAGATLFVDEKKNGSKEVVRTFTTPPLPSGREFSYIFKVEVVRNGQPETLSQKVAFRGGEQLTVDLSQTK